MLDELSKHMNTAKANDLLARLEHRNTRAALAAEAELSMLWSISRVAHLTIEPNLPGSNQRPDASTNNLFGSGSAVVEVRALSDDYFSGNEAMIRTANIITNYANQLCKEAGRYLKFEFLDRSYWNKGFHRERCVDSAFKLSASIEQQLKAWIADKNGPSPDHIQITEGKTDVIVSWDKTKSLRVRVFCRMPPVAYHLEENPIYKALEKKARQVKGAGSGILRAVFLVDAGCELLRRLQPMSAAGLEVGGEEIIRHALRKLSIDVVCVFSPYREQQMVFAPKPRIFWEVTCFDRRESMPESEYHRLNQLAAQLPPARFEGYQARHIHRLGGFSPGRRAWYLPTTIIPFNQVGNMTIKISARLLQEKLAGSIDTATFQRHAFGNDQNYFETELARGRTIQGVRFESGGIDADDDYLIFDMDFDWAVNPLKPSKKPTSD